MKTTGIIALVVLYGLLVVCVENTQGKWLANRKNKTHTKGKDSGIVAHKINFKNLPKHLVKRLDSSCGNSSSPHIKNGKFVRLRKSRIDVGKFKWKRYMVAEFRCDEGYAFRSFHPKVMVCSRKKWVGKKPICDRIKNNLDEPQSDQPVSDNDTLPVEQEDDYKEGEEDYGDEDYEEGDYKEEENYDEVEKPEQSTTGSVSTSEKERDGKILVTVLVTTTQVPVTSTEGTTAKNKDEEEDYEDYDDEYDEETVINPDNLNETVTENTEIPTITTTTLKEEEEEEEAPVTETTTEDDFRIPKKEIQNRQGQDDNKEDAPTDAAFDFDKVSVTTPESNEENDDYDEDYDEEYYDGDSNNKSTPTIADKGTGNLPPQVDVDKVNTALHEIIKNNTQVETTSTPAGVSKSNDYIYEDYEDENNPVSVCELGYAPNDNGTCSDVDECRNASNPCSHGCENTIGSFLCTCPLGFTASSSDPHSCQDVNECLDKPCTHTCVNEAGSYHCECPSGLTLRNATCVNVTCSHAQTKINGVLQCTCPEGFILGPDNRTCEDVNECQLDNECTQVCKNTVGSFECYCEPGYKLVDEKTCVDLDECESNHGCPQLCNNFPGGFNCSCEEGYEYHERENACIDVNECDEALDLDECTQICINYEGGYECGCHPGYKLGSDDATCEDIDECAVNNGNCSQICTNQPSSFHCSCNTGYDLSSDNKTCEVSNPCLIQNGGCSHECTNMDGTALCTCPTGQVLEGKDCFKIDPCVVANGGCSHKCVNVNGNVRCDCPEGYTLRDETTCINPCSVNNGNCSHFCEFVDDRINCLCPDLHVLENRTQCVELDPCSLGNNGGCSHVCSFQDHAVTCSCPSTHELINRTHCLEKNPCLIDNGGCSDTCNFTEGKLICGCPENYYLEGKTCYRTDPCLRNNGGCSHECFSDDAGNIECFCPDTMELEENQKTCTDKDLCRETNGGCSHECRNINNTAQCFCPDHYNLENATTCVPVNPCLVNNGGCSHECQHENGQLHCLCPDLYQLQGGKNCVAVNPCETRNGGCSHVYASINGQVVCKCPPGHELIDKTCFKINPCLVNNGGCSHGCTNDKGQAKCSCPPGYKLFGKRCSDEDPCTKNNGGCSHFCHNKEGRRECSCPAGYILRPNKRVCKEVNECKVNRGGCSHGCRNLPGSYQCTCPHGFVLDSTGNKTCVDIDECLTDNGNCEMLCRNFKGGYRCECPQGYAIQRDKRSCKLSTSSMKCRVPKSPRNGVMRCLDAVPDGLVPPGTKCNVWCNEGFKLEGKSQMLCDNSGTWNAAEPVCVVASCPSLPSIQNGWYLPGVCNSGKVYLGESCKVHCRKGYRRNIEAYKYMCAEDLQWTPRALNEDLNAACVKDVQNVYIKCPGNGVLDFILPEGRGEMLVTIPRPETNVDFKRYVTSHPSWGTRLETTLPAGRSELRFTAMAAGDFNNSASCRLSINVLDKESPRVAGCPGNVERGLGNGENMQVVHWREPTFEDNVGIERIYKSREPGNEFGLGLHHVSYVASDEAGNRAFCHFTVDVKDEYDSEVSANSIKQRSTFTNYNSAGKYRAVLICPSGVQYVSNPPDNYNNVSTNEAGCYWRHVRVSKPMQPQSFKISKVYPESRLPVNVRSNRRVYFKWDR